MAISLQPSAPPTRLRRFSLQDRPKPVAFPLSFDPPFLLELSHTLGESRLGLQQRPETVTLTFEFLPASAFEVRDSLRNLSTHHGLSGLSPRQFETIDGFNRYQDA